MKWAVPNLSKFKHTHRPSPNTPSFLISLLQWAQNVQWFLEWYCFSVANHCLTFFSSPDWIPALILKLTEIFIKCKCMSAPPVSTNKTPSYLQLQIDWGLQGCNSPLFSDTSAKEIDWSSCLLLAVGSVKASRINTTLCIYNAITEVVAERSGR